MSAGELDAYERWMVRSNLETIRSTDVTAGEIVAHLRAGGYERVAAAVDQVTRKARERYVIAGYVDDEDGTLYWSNDDGWGFLSTATVFSEKDKEDYSIDGVPAVLSDNTEEWRPRWAALPRVLDREPIE